MIACGSLYVKGAKSQLLCSIVVVVYWGASSRLQGSFLFYPCGLKEVNHVEFKVKIKINQVDILGSGCWFMVLFQ